MYQLERMELRELLKTQLYRAVLRKPSHHTMNPSIAKYWLQTLHNPLRRLAIKQARPGCLAYLVCCVYLVG